MVISPSSPPSDAEVEEEEEGVVEEEVEGEVVVEEEEEGFCTFSFAAARLNWTNAAVTVVM